MKISTLLFGPGALLGSLACWRLFSGNLDSAGYLLGMSVAFYFAPGRHWPMVAILFSLFAVLAVCDFSSSHISSAIRAVLCHPIFAVCLWLALMSGLYRCWQRQKGVADVQPTRRSRCRMGA
jgi:hypothetical protein